MGQHKTFWKEFWRTIKYFLVAASAGLIQFGITTIFDEWILKKYDHQYHYIVFFVALVISVLWNFTINRKVTFKSVGNIPKAMFKVICYYIVYTPISLQFLWLWDNSWGLKELAVLATIINILFNGVTEYLFMRLFVFKKEIDTAPKKEKKHKKTEVEQPQDDNNN